MHILLAVDGSACSKHMLADIAVHDELRGRDMSTQRSRQYLL